MQLSNQIERDIKKVHVVKLLYHRKLYLAFLFSNISNRLPMEIKEFCLETFLPEVRVATSTILPLPDEERTKLVGNFVGTVMKLGYGGIWEVCINKIQGAI